MKRFALAAAAVLFVAACTTQEEAPAVDSIGTAPAAAPAPMDSVAAPLDSAAPIDSAAAAVDTSAK
jgi:PBP1b-binding outer membrane lipoprotein LpoB